MPSLPAEVQDADGSEQTRIGSIVFPNQDTRNPNANLYEQILRESRAEIRNSVIEFLTNMRWGKETKEGYEIIGKGSKKRKIPTTKEKEGWIPNVEGAKGVMRLEHAIEIADYAADMFGTEFSTTYFDPNTNTLNMAATLAMQMSHMLDNTRYHFDGNETDSASFASKMVSKIHAILNRSLGGYMLRTAGTNIQIQYRHNEIGGQFPEKVKEGYLDKMFKGGRQQQ